MADQPPPAGPAPGPPRLIFGTYLGPSPGGPPAPECAAPDPPAGADRVYATHICFEPGWVSWEAYDPEGRVVARGGRPPGPPGEPPPEEPFVVG